MYCVRVADAGEKEMTKRQRTVLFVFGLLIVFCALLIVVGNFLGPFAGVNLTDAATEGLKVAISALVGALSAMLGANK
jgi:hypothetical protein